MKPLDLQVNILQMNQAAKEISKQKQLDIHQQQYAASHIEQKSAEKNKKVDQVERVEASIRPLENEMKDRRSREEQPRKAQQEKEGKDKKYGGKSSFFDDPSKGIFIDIKE